MTDGRVPTLHLRAPRRAHAHHQRFNTVPWPVPEVRASFPTSHKPEYALFRPTSRPLQHDLAKTARPYHSAYLSVTSRWSDFQLENTGSQGVTLCFGLPNPHGQWRMFSCQLIHAGLRHTKCFLIFLSCLYSLLQPMNLGHSPLCVSSLVGDHPTSSINLRLSCKPHFTRPSTSNRLSRAGNRARQTRPWMLDRKIRLCSLLEDKPDGLFSKTQSPSSSPATVGSYTTAPPWEGLERSSPNASWVGAQMS